LYNIRYTPSLASLGVVEISVFYNDAPLFNQFAGLPSVPFRATNVWAAGPPDPLRSQIVDGFRQLIGRELRQVAGEELTVYVQVRDANGIELVGVF
jgi:hypothetical protein